MYRDMYNSSDVIHLPMPEVTPLLTVLSLSPSLSRYPHQCSALGVHIASSKEAEIQVHGIMGETRRGPVSFQQRTSLCRTLGQTPQPTANVLRQGRTSTTLLLQEKYSGTGWRAPDLQVYQEAEQDVLE